MDEEKEFEGIIPLNALSKNVYPYVLRCAVLSENIEKRLNELNKRNSGDNFKDNAQSGSATAKQVEKLFEAFIKTLKKQLNDPDRYPTIASFRHPNHKVFYSCLEEVTTYLNSISSNKVQQKIGNIEALIMIFSKYASQKAVAAKLRSAAEISQFTSDQVNKFAGILRQVLTLEYSNNPGFSNLMQRLNHSVQSSKETHQPQTLNSSNMVSWLQTIFGVSSAEHNKLLNAYRPHCNEQSAFQDLKKLLTHLELGLPPYLTVDDYPQQKIFDSWKSQERTTINQLLVTISVSNPDLLTLSFDTSTFSAAEHMEKSFVFIPKDPREAYRMLIMYCIRNDLIKKTGKYKAQNSTTLSETSQNIIKECSIRWRMTPTLKLIAHLEAVSIFYDREELDFDTLFDSLYNLQKHISHVPIETWTRTDRSYLYHVFTFLVQKFIYMVCDGLVDLVKFPIPIGKAIIETIDYFFDSFVFKEAQISRHMYAGDLANNIQTVLIKRYENLNETAAPEAGESEAVNLRLMAKLIMRDINHIIKLFSKPLLDSIDVPAMLIEQEFKYFTLQVENMANGRESELIPVEDAFDLYNTVIQLHEMAKRYTSNLKVNINMVHWFNRQFNKWLTALDNKALGWVELAIKYDKFTEVSDTALHSSSVDDLICCFREQLDFVNKLNWPDDLMESRSMAKVAKVIYEGVELYAHEMETLFAKDFDNQRPKKEPPKKKPWELLNFKTKKTEENEDFNREMCIKINNLFQLRGRIQELFANLDYQRYSQVLAEYQKERKDDKPLTRMFYIKLVMAEFLQECDNGKDNDAYVVLSLNDEKCFTSSIQWDNALPKWNETYGVPLSTAQDLKVQVFDKDILSDDLCGEGYLKLDPNADWSSEDAEIWLELEPQGRILFTISTSDEKDDPQYYVSKALKLLEMKEKDLIHQIISKLTGQIKSNLSRKALLQEFNKRKQGTFKKMLTQSNLPSDLEFTEEDCDQALHALVDYLDVKLNLPYSYLYDVCGYKLIKWVWRECLHTLEASIVPSFSSNRAIPKPLGKPDFEFFMTVVELLKVYFHGGEDEDGLPSRMLETGDYKLLHAIKGFYFSSTDNLIRQYLDAVKETATKKVKSNVKHDLGLLNNDSMSGTVTERRPARSKESVADSYKADVILRLIQMKGEKQGIQFVASQLEMRMKQMEWARGKKSIELNGVHSSNNTVSVQ